MIKHVIGDLFAGDIDIIAHQVNCRGVMGSGVAKLVRQEFPGAYASYQSVCSIAGKEASRLLGHTDIVIEKFSDGHMFRVANMFAQDRYGYDGKRYTDYDAFRRCLFQLRLYVKRVAECSGNELSIGMPYRIGCDRGGGDWNIVYKIICEELHDCNVTLFELPK